MSKANREQLFVGTAEAEHMEMYLKAIWHILEQGEEIKINSIARILNIRQPSVVQMLKKLNRQKLVEYDKIDVLLTPQGREIATKMIRNSRLLEVLMEQSLKIDIDEEFVCGVEHHMKQKVADALCIMLQHPRKCPHDLDIPRGSCCPQD